ncbi:MAG: AAA family ATPase [Desulfovibrionales bacterium]|nr:AAA family ATPase [Desulfovibrionales bacterium]
MHITDLHIHGFGIFSDQRLDGLSSGVNVFIGDNEAGKSTCLAFLRYMLFGVPRKGNKKGWLLHEPLRGGNYAGTLGLDTQKFGGVTLERTFKPARLALTGNDGTALGEPALQALLGNVSAILYHTVYGFSLSELQDREALQGDAVRNALYGTVHGGGASYTDVVKQLAAKREALYKKRGTVQPLNKQLKEMERLRKELGASGDSVSEYLTLSEQRAALEETLAQCKARLHDVSLAFGTVTADLRLWGTYTEYKKYQAAYETLLPEIDFPPKGLDRFEELQRQLAEKREELSRTKQSLAAAQDSLCRTQAKIHHPLLAEQNNVRNLSEDKKVIAGKATELSGYSIELRTTDTELRTHYEQLGAGWNAEKVLAFDISESTRREIALLEESITAATADAERTQRDVERAEQDTLSARHGLEQEEQNLNALPEVAADIDLELLTTLAQQRSAIEQSRTECTALEQQQRDKQNAVAQGIEDLGGQWDEAAIRNADTSISLRSRLGELDANRQQAQRAVVDTKKDVEQATSAVADVIQRKDMLESNGAADNHDLEELAAYNTLLRRIRRSFVDVQFAERAISSAGNAGAAVMAVAGGSLIAVPFITPTSFTVAFVGIGLLCVAVCYWLYTRTAARKTLTAKKQAVHRLMQEAPALFTTDIISDDALAAAENRYAELQKQASVFAVVQSQYTDLLEEEKRLRNVLAQAKEQYEAAVAAEAASRSAWEDAVAPFKLPVDATYAVCNAVMARLTECRSALSERDRITQQLSHRTQEISAYCLRAKDVMLHASVETEGQILQKLDEIIVHAKDAAAEREKRSALQERVAVAQKHVAAAASTLDNCREESAKALKHLEEIQKTLQTWCTGRGLSTVLRVQDIPPLLQLIKDTKLLLARRNDITEKMTAAETMLSAYEQQQDALLERTQIAPVFSSGTTVDRRLTQEQLQRLLENSEKASAEVERLTDSIGKDSARADILQQSAKEIETTISGLFTAAGAEDEDAFRRIHEAYTQQQEYQQQMRNLQATLVASTEDGDIEKLAARIGQQTEEELQITRDELEEQRAALEQEKAQLNETSISLRVEQETLTSTEDQLRMRTASEALRAEADSLAKEWARYRIAEHLLMRARERFEREQQPEVVKQAGAFFNTITKGSYQKIFKPLGEDEVYAIAADGSRRKPEDLSRGTAEQLYLSLRLGHILNHSAQNEALPVIMDDIMVNFDPARAANTAQTIAELSAHNQVFLFTCHPQTVALMENNASNVSVFQVANGGLYKQ